MNWIDVKSLALGGFGAAVLAIATAGAGTALAADAVAIPSCYRTLKLPAPPVIDGEVDVLVDQTVLLDDSLNKDLIANVLRNLRPGWTYKIATFSAYAEGRYLNVLASGGIEPGLSQPARNATGVRTLARLDQCLRAQSAYEQKQAYLVLRQAIGGATTTLARSDIMGSLQEISPVVARSAAHRRIVLIASDMLENSAITSFYSRGHLRMLDASKELAKARAAGIFGNFRGAEIYVIGAAWVGTSDGARSYLDPITLNSLKAFWNAYFQTSNARLIEFGEPALLRPID